MDYANFTIRLSDFDGDTLAAAVLDSPAGSGGGAEPVPYRAAVEPLLRRLEDPATWGALGREEWIRLGELLGEMLLPAGVRRALHLSMAQLWAGDGDEPAERGLRLLLELEDPWLESLPWEYAYSWRHKHLRRPAGETLEPLDGFLLRDPRISMARLAKPSAGGAPGSTATVDISGGLELLAAFAEPEDVEQGIGRPEACLGLLRALAAARDQAAARRGAPLDARLVYRLTRESLGGGAAAGESAPGAELDLSMLPALLADEGRAGGWTARFLGAGGGARGGDDAAVHVVDYSGHGGLLPEGLAEGGRLRLAPAPEAVGEPGSAGGRGLRYHRSQRFGRRGSRTPPDAATGRAMLLLEDGAGGHRIVWADELAPSLVRRGARLVVLNTCQPGIRGGGPLFPWSGLGPALVRGGIAAVVGMQKGIAPQAAAAFSTAFYARLSAGGALDEAVTAGREAIFARGGEGSARGMGDGPWPREFGAPVLYLGSAEGLTFQIAGPPGPGGSPPRARREWRVESLRVVGTGKDRKAVLTIGDGAGHPLRRSSLVLACQGRRATLEGITDDAGRLSLSLPTRAYSGQLLVVGAPEREDPRVRNVVVSSKETPRMAVFQLVHGALGNALKNAAVTISRAGPGWATLAGTTSPKGKLRFPLPTSVAEGTFTVSLRPT